mgnify:FL=1
MKSDKNIRQQTLIAVLWNGMSRFGRQALSLLITILLLRILQPEDFGLFALVMLFVSLLKMLVEFGFTAVIIQGKEIDQKALSSIFWFNLINGAFFTLLIIALAPAISKYFDEPALKELIQILSLLILLSAASIVPKALIEKNLKYKFLAKIEISTIFISGATGILMAFNGFGVLSLVAQQLTQSILWFFLIWTGHNWRPLFWFSFKRILNFLTMGASLFSNYFLAFLADNLDDFLIGKKLGKYDLGLYNRGFMIISLPVNLIAHSIGQVMLVFFSLIQ